MDRWEVFANHCFIFEASISVYPAIERRREKGGETDAHAAASFIRI
jgi:hypothetical protein